MKPKASKMKPKYCKRQQTNAKRQSKKTKKQCSEKVGAGTPTRTRRTRPGAPFLRIYVDKLIIWESKSMLKLFKNQCRNNYRKVILKYHEYKLMMRKSSENNTKLWFLKIRKVACANEIGVNKSSQMIPKSTKQRSQTNMNKNYTLRKTRA